MIRVARSLCALALLVVACAATTADEAPNAVLLVAREDLPDPNFKASVVLVMNNLGPAPAGIIVNRPTSIPLSHLFPDVQALAHSDDKVYFGGPVDVAAVSFVFRADSAPDHAMRVVEGVYLSGDRELLRRLLARDDPMRGLRIFAGYAGWAPGQLEREIARGDWALAPADAEAIFERHAERPWPDRGSPDGGHRA